jgi:glucose-6-phosphate 1-dehydrogenase
MEPPRSLEADDIRDAKVAVLRDMRTLDQKDVVLGQYSRSEDGTVPGYAEDETVPSNSITPTFAFAVGYIDNDRWRGVPFIMRTGKGLDNQKAEVRIQFKDPQSGLFNAAPTSSGEPLPRNELVMRVQPNEAIYMKMVSKRPGLSLDTALTDLDLNYRDNFEGLRIPDAYEALILDVLNGEQQNFVRRDELEEAWRIVTPVLHKIDNEHIVPTTYPFGTRGPPEADRRLRDLGYRRSMHDYWPWSVASREDKMN